MNMLVVGNASVPLHTKRVWLTKELQGRQVFHQWHDSLKYLGVGIQGLLGWLFVSVGWERCYLSIHIEVVLPKAWSFS